MYYKMNELYTIIIKSEDNPTKFVLTKEQLNKIQYFNCIDDFNLNNYTFCIELEYNKYLACITDLSIFLNIKSDNYLLIDNNFNRDIKLEDNEMINYCLKTNKLTINDLLVIKKKFLKEIVIEDPALSCLWNI